MMNTKILIGIFALLFSTAPLAAQVQINGWHVYPQLQKCPETVAEYSSMDVSVALPKIWTQEQIAQIKFVWHVSQGEITDGQGTKKITIHTGPGDLTLTVVVSMKGPMFPEVEETCGVSVLRPQAKLFEEFAFSNEEYFQMLSDLFFMELSNNPADNGVVIYYAQTERELRMLDKLMKRWLGFRKFDATRIKTVTVAKSPIRGVQFWMIPPGADEPKPGLVELKRKEPQT